MKRFRVLLTASVVTRVMVKRALTVLVAVLLLGGQGGIARAENRGDITAFDFAFKGEPHGNREAGPYSFAFTNTETDLTGFHLIIFVRIAPAHERATKKEIIAAIDAAGGPEGICPTCFFDHIAGGAFGPPASTTPSVGPDLFTPGPVQLLSGRYAYFCPVHEADGTAHYKLGMFGTFVAR